MRRMALSALLVGALVLGGCSTERAKARWVVSDAELGTLLVRVVGGGDEPPRTPEFIRAWQADREHEYVNAGGSNQRHERGRGSGDDREIIDTFEVSSWFFIYRIGEGEDEVIRIEVSEGPEGTDRVVMMWEGDPERELGEKGTAVLLDLQRFIEVADSVWLPRGLARRE